MFEIAGENYYFDLDKMSEIVRFEPKIINQIDEVLGDVEEVESSENVEYVDPSQMIDVTKWDMVKMLIETLLNENAITDNKMGVTGLERELSLPTKLSFNTLIKYEILKNDD